MKEAQKILDMFVSDGYSSDDIATKLTSMDIKFNLDGEKFTIIEDGSEESDEKTTILTCLSDIIDNTSRHAGFHENTFNKSVYSICKKQIKYVCDMVGITPKQAVLLANIIENKGRHKFDKHDLADSLGMSFIKLLSFENDFKALAEKKLINLTKDEGVSVAKKTISSLSTNEKYTIPVVSGLNTTQLLKEMNEIISSRECEDIDYQTMLDELDILFENNQGTELVHQAKDLGFNRTDMNDDDRTIFYILVKRYIYNNDDRVTWNDFDDIYDDTSDICRLTSKFYFGQLNLQSRKIIEPCNEDGMASLDSFHIVDSVKAKIFAEIGGVRNMKNRTTLKITRPSDIVEKSLFYNQTEEEQVRRLAGLLNQENYKATCERLKASGMRAGFTCIFYGGPGTGKTESVYQLARETGRGIIHVDVSEIKSCWVGESEKLVKGLFDKYRAIVKESEVAPILMFNEADAIFGIRQEGAEKAVDKMENSLQNIILQEMEKLEGILIATTNLTQNLDKAFERRFLYKIKFNKPGIEPKTKIWQSMIPDLSEVQARELAESYDFSGGQIENISRKKMIKSILEGVEPDFKEVKSYCGEELIEGEGGFRRKIGF